MTLHELRQITLDYVVKSMLEQGKPSMESSTCRYRSGTYNEPLCCAVGFLIDEDRYDPSMEEKSPTVVGQMAPTSNPMWQEIFQEDPEFLRALQDCHDSAAVDFKFDRDPFNDGFLWRAKRVAISYNLSWRF